MAAVVGPERTVDAAVAELHPEQIQAALPRLQPDGLSTATRKAMKAHKGLNKQLQETAAAAVGSTRSSSSTSSGCSRGSS
ncbi:MAG TPA: hypothetical protein VL330_22010 [Actinomycetes bacterium]|nr:hypothetical protein [Actinomycetes bacterium]